MSTSALLLRPCPDGFEGAYITYDCDDLPLWLAGDGATPQGRAELFSSGEWVTVRGGSLLGIEPAPLHQWPRLEDAYRTLHPSEFYLWDGTWKDLEATAYLRRSLLAKGIDPAVVFID